jgi:hypothetical protein
MQLACKRGLALASELSPGPLLQAKDGGGWQRSDEELVIAAQNGESRALDELFGRHQNVLYCVVRQVAAQTQHLWRMVKRLGFQLKKSLRVQERDTEENCKRREQFVEVIGGIDLERLIFLDESGVSTQMTRLYASLREMRAFMKSSPMVDRKSSLFWAPSVPEE